MRARTADRLRRVARRMSDRLHAAAVRDREAAEANRAAEWGLADEMPADNYIQTGAVMLDRAERINRWLRRRGADVRVKLSGADGSESVYIIFGAHEERFSRHALPIKYW